MNKTLLLIIVIGAVLLLGGVYVVATSQDSANNNQANISSEADTARPQNESSSNNEARDSSAAELSYIQTTSGELASIDSDKRVLFFYASWCPTCKVLDKEISSFESQIPAGLTIARVDFDKETDLRKKYGVTLQHTLVQIDADGNEVTKWSGSRNLADLLAKVQ